MNKKVTVCLTFDFDAMSVWIGTFRATSRSAISRGEFGNVGAQRLLAMLREWQIPSTWFVPGHTADAFPETVDAIVAAGHEIAHHGYYHESAETPDEEIRDFERAIRTLERVAGVTPVGYRSPAADLTDTVLDCLLTHNFLYDSSMMGNDFSPYYCRHGDRAPADGPYVWGHETNLVEIPFTWGLDDFPIFEYFFHRGGVNQGLASPSQVYEIWAGDFDYLHDRLGSGVYTLTMHPQAIGRGHRLLMLERLIEHIREAGDVTFSTMREVALGYRRAHPLGSG